PGARSAQVAVPTTDDGADEPDERFELRLSSPVNASVADGAGGATIVDDDAPPAPPPATAPPPALPPTTGSSSPTGPAAPGGSRPGAVDRLPQLGVSAPRLQRPKTIAVTISCPREAGRCGGRVTVFTRPNRRSRLKALRTERRLARTTFNLAGASARTLRLTLGRSDLALLRRAGRLNVRAYVVTTDSRGRTGVRRVNGVLIARTTHG
ncbi:MAG: hypothetical protein ACLGHP_09780, partial [Vicinamibacteria bacterium]